MLLTTGAKGSKVTLGETTLKLVLKLRLFLDAVPLVVFTKDALTLLLVVVVGCLGNGAAVGADAAGVVVLGREAAAAGGGYNWPDLINFSIARSTSKQIVSTHTSVSDGSLTFYLRGEGHGGLHGGFPVRARIGCRGMC